ncbi:hypothetical protein ElyMa_001703000 [Elysia marginata]|uniref:Uncharacterized protein n=1 Tax=Elysia marginata TaxID=1093978 RepID=A0AAV4JWA8_9GAST|nr:hypothetical protein ElyMa_001703000 [Elysia marginata]
MLPFHPYLHWHYPGISPTIIFCIQYQFFADCRKLDKLSAVVGGKALAPSDVAPELGALRLACFVRLTSRATCFVPNPVARSMSILGRSPIPTLPLLCYSRLTIKTKRELGISSEY